MKRILIIDDEENIVWSLQRILSKEYIVAGFTQADDGLIALAQGDFNLVITDLRMPGLDGFEVVQWILKNKPNTKIMVITAHGSSTVKKYLLEKGISQYIEKPFNASDLQITIHNLLNEESYKIIESDLVSILTLLAKSKKKKMIVIQAESEHGEIYCKDGMIIQAIWGDKFGNYALRALLQMKGITITVQNWDLEEELLFHPVLNIEISRLLMLGEEEELKDKKETAEPPAALEEDEILNQLPADFLTNLLSIEDLIGWGVALEDGSPLVAHGVDIEILNTAIYNYLKQKKDDEIHIINETSFSSIIVSNELLIVSFFFPPNIADKETKEKISKIFNK